MASDRPETQHPRHGKLSAPDTGGADQRLHALDALRAVAMQLGLVLHAAIPFMRGEVAGSIPFMEANVAFWPAADRAEHAGFDFVVYLIHAFRMPAFFVMAGFFAHLLYRKRGARTFAKQRLLRIGLPYVVALVVIIPIGLGVWFYGWGVRAEMEGPDFAAAVAQHVVDSDYSPMHLWFLHYLIVMYLVTLLVLAIGGRMQAAGYGPKLDGGARRLLASPWGILALTAVAIPPMLGMREWTSDTPYTFLPQVHLLAFYGLFYLFGWLLYPQRDLLGQFATRSGWHLVLGILLVLPLLTLVLGPAWRDAAGQERALLDVLGRGMYALLTWLLTLGMIGIFLRFFDRPSATMQYLADAAYWMYIIHLPVVALLNIAVAGWELPGVVKMVGVVLVSGGLLLASYQLGVRHTIVGRILNGPRAGARGGGAGGSDQGRQPWLERADSVASA